MSNTPAKRRTQEQRRNESRQAVLDSACRLFGDKGYADTSLEEIAADCGLTIRPIYHYFGNKKALFAAVLQFDPGCHPLPLHCDGADGASSLVERRRWWLRPESFRWKPLTHRLAQLLG